MAVRIAVASGKGGTGKTTVATNLFRSLSRRHGNHALLVDCDVEEPNDILFFPDSKQMGQTTINQEIPGINMSRCTFCRKCAEYCEFNAIVVIPQAGFAEINPGLCHSCGACLVACSYEAIHIQYEPIGSINRYQEKEGNMILEGRLKIGSVMQTMMIRSLKHSIPVEGNLVILDAPPGTSCPVVETVSDANYIILVTEPTPFGLHDLKLMIALIRELDKSFGVVINKAGLGDLEIYQYLKKEKLEILSEIPFSKSYASKYARADLFTEIPEEVLAGHQQLLQKLEGNGLLV